MGSIDWLMVCVLLVVFWPLFKFIDARSTNAKERVGTRPSDCVKPSNSEAENDIDLFRVSWDFTHPLHSSSDD